MNCMQNEEKIMELYEGIHKVQRAVCQVLDDVEPLIRSLRENEKVNKEKIDILQAERSKYLEVYGIVHNLNKY